MPPTSSAEQQPTTIADLITSLTHQLVGQAHALTTVGRDLQKLPRMFLQHDFDPAAVPLRAEIIEGEHAFVDAWWRYTDILEPSPTVSVKPSARGWGRSPWEEVDRFAQQVANGHVRMIVGDDVVDDATHRALRHLVAHGAQIRIMHQPPALFFATADGTTALGMEWGHDWPNQMLMLHNDLVTRVMHAWFELMWSTSEPYDSPREGWEPILRLMVDGLDDDGIARELGWSTRTIRRRITDAMDHFDVDNRFALGVAWARSR